MTDERWALPPVEKIYEAYSAVADGRVQMSDGCAVVSSSDNKKQYAVEWDEDVYSSNDNASYWQGYIGYPVIAVLMLQGRLSFNDAVPRYFKGIKWKELNAQYKNQYAKAVDHVLTRLASEGADIAAIKQDAESIYEQIKRLDIKRKRKKGPPKSK